MCFFFLQNLTSGENSDLKESLLCPLTGKLFVDPVSTPYGHTYEKSAILEFMANNNNLDPKAGKRLQREDLRPVRELRAVVEDFRKANIL